MTFRGATESALRQYATFTGRASRSEYWWFYLFTILVGFVTGGIDEILNTDVVSFVVSLALLLPSLAVTVRRLHDSNLSGWWILVPTLGCFVAVVLAVVAVAAGFAAGIGIAADGATHGGAVGVAIGAGVGALLIGLGSLVVSLVLMLRKSTPGANRFGPYPDAGATPASAPGYGTSYGTVADDQD